MLEAEARVQFSLGLLEFREITVDLVENCVDTVFLANLLDYWSHLLIDETRVNKGFIEECKVFNAFMAHALLTKEDKKYLDKVFNDIYIKTWLQ